MPVQIDLSEMLHTPGLRVHYDVVLPSDAELEIECDSPVVGQLVFTNTGNVLVVQGEVTAAPKTACPRCLAEVTRSTRIPVDDEFAVEADRVVGRADDESGMSDPAVAALWEDGHLLNLTELIRQSIVLECPVEPLCREDCRGLCPYCGANRNQTECDCAPPVDSPFAALAGLVKQDAD